MYSTNGLLTRGVKVHPVFLVGIAVGLLSLGSLLGVTVFATIAASLGISVIVMSLEWLVVSLIVLLLGLWRSFEVIGDAE